MTASSPLPPPVALGAAALIGNTPMLQVTRLDTGPCTLFLKLESQNPGGSIKDRVALSMIRAAEAEGRLSPGGVIVEATAGNTGLGLAQVGLPAGYRVLLVVPDKMSREKIQHLRALGAEIRLTRSDVTRGHPEYYQDLAQSLSQSIPGAIYINQFSNPANPLAHVTTTGPEILAQMEGDLDAMVLGVGSGGTLTGLGRYFRRHSPKTRMILADPQGSILAPLVRDGVLIQPGSWAVEGIGEDFIPDNCDLSLVAEAFTISDADSMAAARALLRAEGVLGGSSSGTLLAAALRFCRQQTRPLRVCTLVCDTGSKYLSKVFDDAWMKEQGLLARTLHGDLRDLVLRAHAEGDVVSVAPGDTLATAWRRMRASAVSQLPVLEQGALVGVLDESDLIQAIGLDAPPDPAEDGLGSAEDRFQTPVSAIMVRSLNTVQIAEPLSALLPIFARGEVALVLDGAAFVGLVTRSDLLAWLNLQGASRS